MKEIKSFPILYSDVDEEKGIVTAIVNTFGIVDDGLDIVHPGSFTKTLKERFNRIKVLDQHDISSTLSIVGKPIEIREITREELPESVREEYPEATGGLKTVTQYLLDTEKGLEVFKRIKAKVLNEFSIGYETVKQDFSNIDVKGRQRKVRNIREVKLYEYSNVIWGMNPATAVTGVKENNFSEIIEEKSVASYLLSNVITSFSYALNDLLMFGDITSNEYLELNILLNNLITNIEENISVELMNKLTDLNIKENSRTVEDTTPDESVTRASSGNLEENVSETDESSVDNSERENLKQAIKETLSTRIKEISAKLNETGLIN